MMFAYSSKRHIIFSKILSAGLINACAGFGVSYTLAMLLTISEYGEYGVINSTAALITIILSFSTNKATQKVWTEEGYSQQYLNLLLFHNIFAAGLLLLLYFLDVSIFVLSLVASRMILESYLQIWIMLRNYNLVSCLNIYTNAWKLVVITIFFYLLKESSFHHFLSALSFAALLNFTFFSCLFIYVIRPTNILDVNLSDLRKFYKIAFFTFLGALSAFTYNQADILMTKYLINSTVAGVYTFSFFILMAMVLPVTLVANQIGSQHVLESRSIKAGKNKTIKLILKIFVTYIIIVMAWNMFQVPILKVIGLTKYSDHALIIGVYLFSAPFLAVNYVLGLWITRGGLYRYKTYVMMILAVFNIVANYVGIKLLGDIGPSIVTLMTFFIMACCYWLTYVNGAKNE